MSAPEAEIPTHTPDGKPIEKVPVTPPLVVAQVFTKISQITKRIDNAKSIAEAQSFSHQLSLTTAKSARELKLYAEEHEPRLDLLNVAEELEIISAMAAKLHAVVKAHSRPTEENAQVRGKALVELAKAVKNTGIALHEYLLALGDLQKASAPPAESPAP